MSDISLVVDGSTYAGTVAVLRDGEVVAERSLPDSGIPARGQRGEDFMPMVVACLGEAGVAAGEVSRVICGSGPGSFTSLRIAASIAKGIAAGVGCPLYAVSSLLLIPTAADLPAGNYLAVLPAMRGENFVLATEIEADGTVAARAQERVVSVNDVESIAAKMGMTAVGPGIGNDLRPRARGAARILDQIIAGGECNLDTWEPTYGRLAEAQVKWEAQHGRPFTADA